MSEPEVFLFPDTNVFMHYRMFDEVDWPALVGGKAVVICLSRTLTKELEEKKYDQKLSSRKRDRVRKISTKLDRFLEAGGAVRSGVRLQIVRHPKAATTPPELDLDHADDAHVATAYQHKTEHGGDVRVVSADTNLRHSARTLGLGLLTLPDEFALPPEPDDLEVELKRVRAENEKLKSVPRPRLALCFADRTAVARFTRPANLPTLPPDVTDDGSDVSEADESIYALVGMPRDHRIKLVRYHRAKAEFELEIALTVKLQLMLFNDGEAPARGVNLELKFPDGMTIREELPDAPKEPKFPSSMFDFAEVYPSLAMPYDPTDWDIEDNVVQTWREEVVHSLHRTLPLLYVLPAGADATGFAIECRLVTSEPPTKEEFTLQIVYEDGQ